MARTKAQARRGEGRSRVGQVFVNRETDHCVLVVSGSQSTVRLHSHTEFSGLLPSTPLRHPFASLPVEDPQWCTGPWFTHTMTIEDMDDNYRHGGRNNSDCTPFDPRFLVGEKWLINGHSSKITKAPFVGKWNWWPEFVVDTDFKGRRPLAAKPAYRFKTEELLMNGEHIPRGRISSAGAGSSLRSSPLLTSRRRSLPPPPANPPPSRPVQRIHASQIPPPPDKAAGPSSSGAGPSSSGAGPSSSGAGPSSSGAGQTKRKAMGEPETDGKLPPKRPRANSIQLDNPDDRNLMCPITLQLFVDPVVASDGNTYSRAAIEQWDKNNHTSPVTREDLTRAGDKVVLTQNRLIAKNVEKYKEEVGQKLIELIERIPEEPECAQRAYELIGETGCGLNVEARRASDRRTPLLIAAELRLYMPQDANNRRLWQRLRDAGVNMDAKDDAGKGLLDIIEVNEKGEFLTEREIIDISIVVYAEL